MSEKKPQFAQIPIEAIMDDRLTPTQFKVLVAIISFRNAKTGKLNPSRAKISARCNIRETRISETTTELERLGWIKKAGLGGYSKSCEYEITVPDLGIVVEDETVTENVTVNDPKTVPDSGTVLPTESPPITVPDLGTVIADTVPNSGTVVGLETVPDSGTVDQTTVPNSGTGGVPNSGTRKEHRKEHIKPNTKHIALPEWLSEEIWKDWVEHKKAIKSPMSPRAITLSISKLTKLREEGYSPESVINQSIEMGWKGLFPVRDEKPVVIDKKTSRQAYYEEANRRRESYGQQQNTVDGDAARPGDITAEYEVVTH